MILICVKFYNVVIETENSKMAENLTQTQNTGNTFMALKSIIRKITLNQKGGNLTWIQKQISIKIMFDP